MSNRKFLFLLLAILAGAFLCLVIIRLVIAPPARETQKVPPITPAPRKNYEVIEVKEIKITLEIPQAEVKTGRAISIKLVLENVGDAPRKLSFSSGQKFDVVVDDFQGKEIWRWSVDKVFTMMLQEDVFEPGQREVHAVSWDQRDLQGQLVSVGEYRIKGESMARELRGSVVALDLKITD